MHHVGLAVNSVKETANFCKIVFGAKITDYAMETPDFYSCMLRIGQGLFELLEPRGENGFIQRFIEKNGEGIHHISVRVADLNQVIQTCEKEGIRLTMGNRLIRPKSAHGVQIELIGEN